MSAKIIVIEGLDGSGKATQAKLLTQYLLKNKKSAKIISFPDYNSPSSTLVKLYLNGEISKNLSDINAYAASSFYAVDRYISYVKHWKSFYDHDNFIVSDRYTTSNAIYQMTKLSKSDWDNYIKWLEDYEYNKLNIPSPNLVIYLDMPITLSQNLINLRYNGDTSKKDIHEANLDFLYKCRDTANYLSKKLSWSVLNCYEKDSNGNYFPRKIDDISNDIIKIINRLV